MKKGGETFLGSVGLFHYNSACTGIATLAYTSKGCTPIEVPPVPINVYTISQHAEKNFTSGCDVRIRDRRYLN